MHPPLGVNLPQPNQNLTSFYGTRAMTRIQQECVMAEPTVWIETRIGAHENPEKIMEAILTLFPDFQPDSDIEIEDYPRSQPWMTIQGPATDLSPFLQNLREQRILDTAMDAMSMDITEQSTMFRISRQAALVGKVGFVLEGDSSLGGDLRVLLEHDDIQNWIESATDHPGRRNVPRSIGDNQGMEMDGSPREWTDE